MYRLHSLSVIILLCLACLAMWGVDASAQVATDYSFLCRRSGTIEITPEADSWQYEVGEGSAEELIISYSVGVQFGKKGSDCSYARLTLDKQQSVSSVSVSAKRATNSTATLQVFVGDVPIAMIRKAQHLTKNCRQKWTPSLSLPRNRSKETFLSDLSKICQKPRATCPMPFTFIQPLLLRPTASTCWLAQRGLQLATRQRLSRCRKACAAALL